MKEFTKNLCDDMSWTKYLRIPEFMRISGREVEEVLLSLNLPKGSSILDIGCGYGRISLFLKNCGYNVTAIDSEQKMVEEARKKGINAQYGDAENLQFSDNEFDLVVTDGLLEHFENPEKFLSEELHVTKDFVVNFIPIDTKINRLFEFIQLTPKVFWRSEPEWLLLHKKYFKSIEVKNLRRLHCFVCRK